MRIYLIFVSVESCLGRLNTKDRLSRMNISGGYFYCLSRNEEDTPASTLLLSVQSVNFQLNYKMFSENSYVSLLQSGLLPAQLHTSL